MIYDSDVFVVVQLCVSMKYLLVRIVALVLASYLLCNTTEAAIQQMVSDRVHFVSSLLLPVVLLVELCTTTTP